MDETPTPDEAIILGRILRGESPILLVTHDEDDPAWQILDGGQVFEEDAEILPFAAVIAFDPSLAELAQLPRGWYAQRIAKGSPWEFSSGEPTPDAD